MNGLFQTDVTSSAIISDCGLYRYRLSRTWDVHLKAVCFIGLNPSTADALVDDPTIRRCMGFARLWECGGIEVVNLFALRATDPRELQMSADPVGVGNDRHIRTAAEQCYPIVAAWGTKGTYRGRDLEVKDILRNVGVRVSCFGRSKDGHPNHPLYLPADRELENFIMEAKP